MFLSFFSTYLLPVIVLAGLGGVFGVLIALASKYFAVKVDDRVEQVLNMLPGYNCGACGHPGCSGMANAIIHEGGHPKECKPIKPEQIEAIVDYLKNNKQQDA